MLCRAAIRLDHPSSTQVATTLRQKLCWLCRRLHKERFAYGGLADRLWTGSALSRQQRDIRVSDNGALAVQSPLSGSDSWQSLLQSQTADLSDSWSEDFWSSGPSLNDPDRQD